jgi:hypothetical protein
VKTVAVMVRPAATVDETESRDRSEVAQYHLICELNPFVVDFVIVQWLRHYHQIQLIKISDERALDQFH